MESARLRFSEFGDDEWLWPRNPLRRHSRRIATTSPFAFTNWGIQVYDNLGDNGGDRVDFNSNGLAVSGGTLAVDPNFFTGYAVEIIFGAPSTSILTSDALPDPLPSLSTWENAGGGATLFFFDFRNGSNQSFSGAIDSLQATPGPTSFSLILLNLLVACGAATKSKLAMRFKLMQA